MTHSDIHPCLRLMKRLALILLLLAVYLCTGAAWKILMIVRHPEQGRPMVDLIRDALAPYSSLPVGWALGPRFGRLAGALRLASATSGGAEVKHIHAINTLRGLEQSDGAWADAALYELAMLEARQGLPGESPHLQSFLLILDSQRWGRSTIPESSGADLAITHLRRLIELYPGSPVAADALEALADLQHKQWEFTDEEICRMASSILRPAPAGKTDDRPTKSQTERPELAALAMKYVLYLRSTSSRRSIQRAELHDMAVHCGDTPLERWVGGTEPSAPAANPGYAIPVNVNRTPEVGVHVALLDIPSLRESVSAEQAFGNKARDQLHVSISTIRSTLDASNPARSDDPLRLAASVLQSVPIASEVIRHLPLAVSGPSGAVFSTAPDAVGVAALLNVPAGPDLCIQPPDDSDPTTSLQLVTSVQVLHTALASNSPPILRWRAYPGAASYRAYVILESPSAPGAAATEIAPEWSRRTLWWRNDIRATSIQMDPRGFVGPASDLAHNGIWAGESYRVVLEAFNGTGQAIATSIGLADHPDEYFTPIKNWLGLDGAGAQAPARAALHQFRWPRPWRHNRYREMLSSRVRIDAPQPLDDVLTLARSEDETLRTGTPNTVGALNPVAARSPSAVPLTSWPSIHSDGQGLIPLQTPLLRHILSSPTLGFGVMTGTLN